MPSTRTVVKNLAGIEDLLIGRGSVMQSRGGASYPVTKLSFTLVVDDVAKLATLDPVQFPSVAVVSGGTFTLYEYAALQGYQRVVLDNINTYAGASFSLTAEAVTPIITIDVPTRAEGTTVLAASSAGFLHSSGKLTYTGVKRKFKIDVSVMVRENNKDELHFYLARNQGIITETKQVLPSTSAGSRSLSFSHVLELQSSQQLELFVANHDSIDDITFAQYNMAIS